MQRIDIVKLNPQPVSWLRIYKIHNVIIIGSVEKFQCLIYMDMKFISNVNYIATQPVIAPLITSFNSFIASP